MKPKQRSLAAAQTDPVTTDAYVKQGKYYENLFSEDLYENLVSEDYDKNLFSWDYAKNLISEDDNGNLFIQEVNHGIEGELSSCL